MILESPDLANVDLDSTHLGNGEVALYDVGALARGLAVSARGVLGEHAGRAAVAEDQRAPAGQPVLAVEGGVGVGGGVAREGGAVPLHRERRGGRAVQVQHR